MKLTLDPEGYPTDDALEQIEKAEPKTPEEIRRYIAEIREIWNYRDWGFHQNGNALKLSTAGWSGNESIISAMRQNIYFWPRCWKVHRVGGHYEFELPKENVN